MSPDLRLAWRLMAGPDNDLDRPRSVPTVFLSAMASAASTDPASPLEHRRQIEPTVAGPFAGDMIRNLRKPRVDAMITAACATIADSPETRQWTQCSPTCAPDLSSIGGSRGRVRPGPPESSRAGGPEARSLTQIGRHRRARRLRATVRTIRDRLMETIHRRREQSTGPSPP